MGVINTYLVFRAITLDEIMWEKSVDGDWEEAGSELCAFSFEGLKAKGYSREDLAETDIQEGFHSPSSCSEEEEANDEEGDTGMKTMLERF